MYEKLNTTKTTPKAELNNEQAIIALYELLKNAFPNKNIQREPLNIQTIGNYGIINPGTKHIQNVLLKLDRKTRSKDDADKNASMAEVINHVVKTNYHKNECKLYNEIRDWSRFTIVIPDYASAPAVVASFLAKFGGKIDFHERDNYEAIHQHTTYKDVNVEFQFHTKEYAELKRATDIFYHEYNNIVVPKNSRIESEKDAIEKQMTQYCQIVYNRSDFKESLPAVRQVADDYLEKKPQTPKQRLRHFLEIVAKAEYVQKELSEILPQFLAKINEADKIQLGTKNI